MASSQPSRRTFKSLFWVRTDRWLDFQLLYPLNGQKILNWGQSGLFCWLRLLRAGRLVFSTHFKFRMSDSLTSYHMLISCLQGCAGSAFAPVRQATLAWPIVLLNIGVSNLFVCFYSELQSSIIQVFNLIQSSRWDCWFMRKRSSNWLNSKTGPSLPPLLLYLFSTNSRFSARPFRRGILCYFSSKERTGKTGMHR